MSRPGQPKPSAAASWSLGLGILSITCFRLLASIPAILLGCFALGKTSGPNPERSGKGNAIVGIITGALGVVFGIIPAGIWLAILVPAAPVNSQGSTDPAASAELANLGSALRSYATLEGTYPQSLEDLIPLYLPDNAALTMQSATPGREVSYRYRPEGFHSGDAAESPVALTPEPVQGQHLVLFADGRVEPTGAPEILALFP